MEGGYLLKLIIEKGHREGETLEFQPGKVVKIGRVVKGNTLTIKDAGISSNHLSITFISGEWILSDLDSSNGTTVNGDIIGVDKPAKLGDGDTIKIGELTSIKVSFGARNDYSGLRRNPSRRAVKNVEQNSVGIVATRSRRGGNLASIVEVKEPELSLGLEGEVWVSRRRHRKAVPETVEAQESFSTVVEVATLKNDGPNKTNKTRQPSTRTTGRNQKKTNSSLLPPLNSTVDIPSVLEEEASAQIGEKKTQRGRPRKKKIEESHVLTHRSEALAVNSSLKDYDLRKEDDEIDGNEPKLEEVAVGFEEEEASAHIVEKKTQRGRGKKKNRVGNKALDGNSSLNDSHFEEETNKVQSKNNSLGASDPRKEDDEIHGNEPMLQENADGFEKELGKEEEPDLEKMTLGGWFDYLQVSLPKKINDALEEIISDMREKARMYKELMVQKKNEKNNEPSK